jgi:hypothetical protein
VQRPYYRLGSYVQVGEGLMPSTSAILPTNMPVDVEVGCTPRPCYRLSCCG